MIDWLIDWLTDWLISWLNVDWLFGVNCWYRWAEEMWWDESFSAFTAARPTLAVCGRHHVMCAAPPPPRPVSSTLHHHGVAYTASACLQACAVGLCCRLTAAQLQTISVDLPAVDSLLPYICCTGRVNVCRCHSWANLKSYLKFSKFHILGLQRLNFISAHVHISTASQCFALHVSAAVVCNVLFRNMFFVTLSTACINYRQASSSSSSSSSWT